MTSVNQRLCSLSVPALATLSTLQKWPSFFFWSNIPPVLSLTVWCPDSVEFVGLKVGHNCTQNSRDEPQHVCYGLALAVAKWQYLDTKPPLSFRFISRVLKATECNSADGFRCTHLSHSATSNFKGVDRKQNMYYEVGDCRQWIIGCQLEKKKNSTYWEAVPAHALLSWAQ